MWTNSQETKLLNQDWIDDMATNDFWKNALLCIDSCQASYKSGEQSRSLVRQYVLDYDEFIQFSVGTSQATCLKTIDHQYVVAFRGTDDLDSALIDLKSWQVDSETMGDVHAGFKQYIDNIDDGIVQWLESYSVLEQKMPVVITGHSLGGAAASIFAARLYALGYKNISLFTFGSPRVGDKKWATQFKDIPAYRFVNNNDIVTRIPFAGWYQHIGELFYIGYDGKITNASTSSQRFWDRIKSRVKALQKFQLFDGTYDHPGIYYRARINEQIQRIKAHSKS